MAATNPDRARLSVSNSSEGAETSPEGTKLRLELNPKGKQKVGVVYYLSRNGQLEQPHFMEISPSSPEGLYLRDVTNTINLLRGQGMASLYSWSSKRRYKNGFVSEDLSENDFIKPCHGDEYILKGSLLVQVSQSFRSYETISSFSSKSSSSEVSSLSSDQDSSSEITRRKSHPRTTFDEAEHKVYRVKTAPEFAPETVSESTQTEARLSRMVMVVESKDDVEDGGAGRRLRREEEGSPHSLGSSSRYFDTLEELSEGNGSSQSRYQRRMKASLLLMKLLGCGSKRFQ